MPIELASVLTTYRFDVDIVSPLHVGMAQEKHYVRGLDYLLDDKTVQLINADALLRAMNPQERNNLTAQLAAGKTEGLEPTIRQLLPKYPAMKGLQLPLAKGEPAEIRRMYQTGLGQYAIPGTSVKGALRSVLLATRKTEPGQQRNSENDLLGMFEKSVMRFVHVGDMAVPAAQMAVWGTKIYSADSKAHNIETRGEWKHGRTSSHSSKFDDTNPRYEKDAFMTFYELAIPDSIQANPLELTIRLGQQLPHALKQYAEANIPGYQKLLDGKPGDWLVQTIRAHTKRFLERERQYFEKFDNKDLNDRQSILDYIDAILAENNHTDACLLRVGAGVGFHSITGDWQFNDHTAQWNTDKNAIRHKTRKFAVDRREGKPRFELMGFLKLTRQTEASKIARQQRQYGLLQQAQAAAEAEAKRLEDDRLAAEEARKPKVHPGPVTKGMEVDAEVVISAKPNRVKIFVAGYEDKQFEMIDSAQQLKGYTCRVALVIEKGKILRVRHLTKK
ncbi:RAMP superfamily CRISPR-associated protein [Fibrella arboris]|uniref:RAMP superfamily CRISPR-associated protein n=1 Tax=Fibrella arboris TaxID=3242486 RepID=UPI0035218571